MKKFKSVYEVKSYSPILILNRIRENDLVVEDFKEISPYLFHFKAYKKDEKKLKKIMPDLNCIKDPFFIHFFKRIGKHKSELLAIIVILPLFYFMMTRIYKLNITGNDNTIKEEIKTVLYEQEIKPFAKIPTKEKLKEVNDYILEKFDKRLESFELLIKGGDINVSFNKYRPPIILPDLKKNYYAKEDGVITRLELSYGIPLVKEGDYVKKGQLLIAGNIDENDKKAQAYGKVFAKCWKEIVVQCQNIDIATNYQTLLSIADQMILDKNSVLIDRLVLKYEEKNTIAMMKLHYTIEKNIAISQ